MAVLSLVLLLAAVIGCKSGLETLTILWNGYDIPGEYDGLKGKKVAVVCKPLTGEEFSNSGAAKALAEGISERLKANIKDIHIIDTQRINKLLDEKGVEDYLAIGKALKADMVVAVDIESFGILDGQTLYRGRSTVNIKVYDVAEKTVEWHKSPPRIEYPRTGSIPMADQSENDFRNKYVGILADQISHYFYRHDYHDDYGSDADSNH
jgi:hypothetical protein